MTNFLTIVRELGHRISMTLSVRQFGSLSLSHRLDENVIFRTGILL